MPLDRRPFQFAVEHIGWEAICAEVKDRAPESDALDELCYHAETGTTRHMAEQKIRDHIRKTHRKPPPQ